MDSFELAVEHHGKSVHYPCIVQHFGYSYRFTVIIDQHEVYFEADEENELRARTPDNATLSANTTEKVISVAKELQRLLDHK